MRISNICKMKAIVFLVLYLSVSSYSQSELNSQELGQFSENELECIDKLRLNSRTITTALKQLYLPENNEELNHFMECTWKKDGLLAHNGSLLLDQIKYFVKGVHADVVGNPELAEAFAIDTIGDCKNVRGLTPGHVVVLLMNCILRKLYV